MRNDPQVCPWYTEAVMAWMESEASHGQEIASVVFLLGLNEIYVGSVPISKI